MLKPWSLLSTELLLQTRVFDLFKRRARSPRSGGVHDFYLIHAPNWVNIVPITSDGRMVLVRQYRQGVEGFTLEIPGGMIDPADQDPEHAARRELREETGYTAGSLLEMGWVEPNPALQANRCYTFLAEDLGSPGELQPDGGEDLEVEHVPLAQIPALVADGSIRHSLVIAAFALTFGLGPVGAGTNQEPAGPAGTIPEVDP